MSEVHKLEFTEAEMGLLKLAMECLIKYDYIDGCHDEVYTLDQKLDNSVAQPK